jgi:hypothetical protein
MHYVLTQNLFLDAPQCRAHGRDLRHNVDTIAVVVDHAGKTANLTLDAAQPLQARRFRALGHA